MIKKDRKPRAIDISGMTFGRLTVIKRAPKQGTQSQAYWHCKCDCGKEFISRGSCIRRGRVKSCGCLNREIVEAAVTKHGGCAGGKTRLYETWKSMRKRCGNPNTKSYKNYGGRGIYVCQEWEEDFSSFRNWAESNGYDEQAPKTQQQLDRIDNDGPYAPWNCKFSTAKEQANNRRERKYKNVVQKTEDEIVVAVWPSARRAASELNFCRTPITRACHTGKKAYGYKWSFCK